MLIEASRSPDLPVAIRAAVLLGPGPGWTALFGRALAAPEWPTRAAAVAAVADGLGAEAATVSARRALGDARIEVRLAAARALLRLGHEAPARAELARAAAASPPHLGAAAELARRWRDPAALAALATLAGAPDRDARAAAIAAHGSVEHISDALVAALADSAVELRIAAAAAVLEALDKNR
jgi:HEAT repeat protein